MGGFWLVVLVGGLCVGVLVGWVGVGWLFLVWGRVGVLGQRVGVNCVLLLLCACFLGVCVGYFGCRVSFSCASFGPGAL